MQKEQLCEANYYIGMQRLLAGDPRTAARFFHACLDTGEFDFMEYSGARAELNTLENRPKK